MYFECRVPAIYHLLRRCRRPWWKIHQRAKAGSPRSSGTAIGRSWSRTGVACAPIRATAMTGRQSTGRVLTASVMPFERGIIDGEVVVLDELHRSNFSALQAAIGREPSRLLFVAFDLLHLDGMDLRQLPLVVRRERLAAVSRNRGWWPHPVQRGAAGTPSQIFDVVDQAGLEGIVTKRADSKYRSGRTRDWLKIKSFEEAEFDLVGVRRERGKPAMALLAEAGRPVGSAFITLPSGIRERLWQRRQSKPLRPHQLKGSYRYAVAEAGPRRPSALPQGRGDAAPRDVEGLAGRRQLKLREGEKREHNRLALVWLGT